MNFKTDSSETVGRISSRASGGTNSSQPQKPKKARASTNRGELELDQPLDRLQPVAAKRGAVYPPASKAVKRSFCLNTTLGILMIALLVFGSIFGKLFSQVCFFN
jgi:hypothetical protein